MHTPSGSSTNLGCNAIKVTEQTSVPPLFMGVLGFGSQKVTASATAGIAGGIPHPLDVEVVADSTASMQDQCSASVSGIPSNSAGIYVNSGTPTKLDCAKAGIQSLLNVLDPCSVAVTSCGSVLSGTSDVANPLDRVGLMVFPGLDSTKLSTNALGVVPQETDCLQNVAQGQSPAGDVTYGANANYQVVPFSSDFRTSDTAASLNPGSALVNAVTWDSCPGSVYPTNGGSSSVSSISTAGTSDITRADNGSTSSITSGGSTVKTTGAAASIGGDAATNSTTQSTSAVAGITGDAGTNTTTASTPAIAGIAGDAATNTTTASATGSSVAISRPTPLAANDYVLVSLTVTNLGTGTICAPDSSWSRSRSRRSRPTAPESPRRCSGASGRTRPPGASPFSCTTAQPARAPSLRSGSPLWRFGIRVLIRMTRLMGLLWGLIRTRR